MQIQTQTTQPIDIQPIDILQQFDVLLKNHSIIVTDRENLAMLFEKIVDLCTQMPKTKLKAALKAATKEPKEPKLLINAKKAKAQSKTKTNPLSQPQSMVGPEGAADAPVISDLVAAPAVRGRGRPRKATTEPAPVATATANPNAETAEKKRRGRPKKDKSVTISSNDDEDALIAQMMLDVASMQKDEEVMGVHAVDHDGDETDTADEADEPVAVAETESLSPIVQTSPSTSSFQQLEVEAPSAAPSVIQVTKAAKATKVAKAAKEPKVAKAAKEPKAAPVKAAKPAPVKAAKAVNVAEVIAPAPMTSAATSSNQENNESNGKIYLLPMVSTDSFSYNGKTYLRTETDNVYDNLTHELIGVWDHANHEIIAAFDDDEEMYYSDDE